MTTEIENKATEEPKNKPYELHDLQAKHLFMLTRVVSAIGIKKLANVFETKADVGDLTGEDAIREIGYSTIIEVVGIVIDNLPNCQDDLFKFLAAISNLNEKQVAALPLADFIDMIYDVVKKPEFADFFKRCAAFLK